ncbi:MAG: glutamine synthetase [Candidatus Bathyarchaeota archaeon]|nr:glutamine synthetase [Candidatus Bathyarchaeota archaeon]
MEKNEMIEKALEILKVNKIRWVNSTFTDIRGLIHDMVIPAREYLEGKAFTVGLGFDGSSVRGYKSINESDMIYAGSRHPDNIAMDKR